MLADNIIQTLELIKQGKIDLQKATFSAPSTATSGLQLYDLEAPAKELIPIILPLLRSTPRSGGGKSIQSNWEVITGQNTGKLTAGVPEGKRNASIAFTRARYNAVYKTLAMDGTATLQAQLAAAGFDDVKARSRTMSLNSLFVEQERILFGGNSDTGVALGTGPTPVVTKVATGGVLGAALHAMIVPLSIEGWQQSSVAGGVATTRSVTPNGSSTSHTVNLGNGAISAEGSLTGQTGTDNRYKLTWASVKGAAAYAVYAGTSTGAANLKLQKIVYGTTVTLGVVALETTTQAANATGLNTDNSKDQYIYDGMFTQVVKSNIDATGGYFLSLNPTGVAAGTLTADGKGGIDEFNTFLINRYNLYKVTEFEIHVGGNMMNNVSNKIRAGSSTTPFSIQVTDGNAQIKGGGRAVAYVHPLTGRELPLVLNPNVPDGIVFFKGTQLPAWFANTNIANIWEVGERLSYTSIDWAMRTLEYETTAIVDEVLKGYVPFANGVLADIELG